MKQILFPRLIYKINSKELLDNDLNIDLSFNEARMQDKIISISDNQVIRWIDKLNNKKRNEEKNEYNLLIKELKTLKKEKNSNKNKEKIKEIYLKINKMQYIPELINIVMSKPNDIDKLKNGFTVNGVTYHRFIGSPNQVKKSTVMYSSLVDRLNPLVENGRDPEFKIIPAKYEAYKALALSGSYPVTNTDRILVVDDLVTIFTEDVIFLDDRETDEPITDYKSALIELDESDGYGLITPSLAEVWSDDMELDYIISGCCIRHAFTKGMVAAFDFREFARRCGKRIVKDVWGKERDINSIDIILTTSMMKLWKAYDSLESFLEHSKKNDFGFSITKINPKEWDKVRTLNYQYIQSYDLDDESIYDLISPTVNELKDVATYDINKSLLFLRGLNITNENAGSLDNDFVKAISIDERMMSDPYVIDRVNMLIKKKIDDAKIGVLKAEGNYGIVVGDPYALCQKIFDVNVKNEDYGLLKSGEIYHKFWQNKNVDKVCCYRSPMTVHSNIRKVNISYNKEADYWYQYCKGLVMINCHDSLCHALNGMDKDRPVTPSL